MRTFRDILNLLFIPALLISLPYILLCLPAANGYVPFEVKFESMDPTYKSGELVYYVPVAKADLNVGDLVVFDDNIIENARIFHRIVDIKDDGYVTKGDGKDLDDENLLLYEDVIGKVVGMKIPMLGPYLTFATSNMIVIYASVGLWAFYGFISVLICLRDFGKRRKMKKQKRLEAKQKKLEEQKKAAEEKAKAEAAPAESSSSEQTPVATPAAENTPTVEQSPAVTPTEEKAPELVAEAPAVVPAPVATPEVAPVPVVAEPTPEVAPQPIPAEPTLEVAPQPQPAPVVTPEVQPAPVVAPEGQSV